ncbi:hypothetical protein ACQ1SO_002821 [Pseudomonas aeruginosa]
MEVAKKYTYEKPLIISSPKSDYLYSTKIYRRYLSHIIIFNTVFCSLIIFPLNYFFSNWMTEIMEEKINIITPFTDFFKDLFNVFVRNGKIQDVIFDLVLSIILFSIVYFPSKKLTYQFTKPICKEVIEEGLYIIKGSDVFKKLQNAFDEMINQDK